MSSVSGVTDVLLNEKFLQLALLRAVAFQLNLKYLQVKITKLLRVVAYFKIVSNFTHLTAREITNNNFEISLVVFMSNIAKNHAITYTNPGYGRSCDGNNNFSSKLFSVQCTFFPLCWVPYIKFVCNSIVNTRLNAVLEYIPQMKETLPNNAASNLKHAAFIQRLNKQKNNINK